MHDRDTQHANPLAAPIEREPISPEPADPRIIRSQAYTEGLAAGRAETISATSIEDVRHLAAMARAQGRVEGINEERIRLEAIVSARLNAPPGALENARCELDDILAAIRSGESASDLTAERATSARLADRCLDLGRELESLRAAVRAHEATVRTGPRSRCWDQADIDLWAAAKPADG